MTELSDQQEDINAMIERLKELDAFMMAINDFNLLGDLGKELYKMCCMFAIAGHEFYRAVKEVYPEITADRWFTDTHEAYLKIHPDPLPHNKDVLQRLAHAKSAAAHSHGRAQQILQELEKQGLVVKLEEDSN